MHRYVLLSRGELIPVEGEPAFGNEQIVKVGELCDVTICYDAILGEEGLAEAQRLLELKAPPIEGPAILIVTDLQKTTLDPFSWGITLGLDEMTKIFKGPKE